MHALLSPIVSVFNVYITPHAKPLKENNLEKKMNTLSSILYRMNYKSF